MKDHFEAAVREAASTLAETQDPQWSSVGRLQQMCPKINKEGGVDEPFTKSHYNALCSLSQYAVQEGVHNGKILSYLKDLIRSLPSILWGECSTDFISEAVEGLWTQAYHIVNKGNSEDLDSVLLEVLFQMSAKTTDTLLDKQRTSGSLDTQWAVLQGMLDSLAKTKEAITQEFLTKFYNDATVVSTVLDKGFIEDVTEAMKERKYPIVTKVLTLLNAAVNSVTLSVGVPKNAARMHTESVALATTLQQQLESSDVTQSFAPEDICRVIECLAKSTELTVSTTTTRESAEKTLEQLDQLVLGSAVVTGVSLPVYMASISGIASLGVTWTTLLPSCLQTLRSFLVTPSPVLLHLQKLPGSSMKGSPLDTIRLHCFDSIAKLLHSRKDQSADAANDFVQALPSTLMLHKMTGRRGSRRTSEGEKEAEELAQANIIRTLVAVGKEISQETITHDTVIAGLHQRLFNPPSKLDSLIVEQLGILAVAIPAVALKSVVDMLIQICGRMLAWKQISDAEVEDSFIDVRQSGAVYKTLEHIASNIENSAQIRDIFEALLETFVRLGSQSLRDGMNATRQHAESLKVLLPVLGKLASGLEDRRNETVKPRMLSQFRGFWLFAATAGYCDRDASRDVVDALQNIAFHSAALIDKKASTFLGTELEVNTGAIAEKVTNKNLASLRSRLVTVTSNDCQVEINKLDFGKVTYFLSVYYMESFRLRNKGVKFFTAFEYLEDKGIIRTQAGVMRGVVTAVFTQYLHQMCACKRTDTLNHQLEELAVYLLVKFNHQSTFVKEAADSFLPKLADKFPHLLFSGHVISAMLNLLEALNEACVTNGVIALSTKMKFDHPPFSLVLADTQKVRDEAFADFNNRCVKILEQAITFAPEETTAHLQRFVSGLKGMQRDHVGVQVAARVHSKLYVHKSVKEVYDSSGNSGTSMWQNLSQQNYYTGTVNGVYSMGESIYGGFVKDTIDRLREAAAHLKTDAEDEETQQEFDDLMHKAAGIIVAHHEKNGVLSFITDDILMDDIVHAVVRFPLKAFTKAAVSSAVSCWRWVIAAAPSVEEALVCEIRNVWRWTIAEKLGVFSQEHGGLQSPENVTGVREPGPNIEPHTTLIEFMMQRFEIVKRRSHVLSRQFLDIVNTALTAPHGLCQHPSAIVARTKIFIFAFRVISSDGSIDVSTKVLLRDRLYSNLLLTFTRPKAWPAKHKLHPEIAVLMHCWKLMLADKKSCKELDSLLLQGATSRPEIAHLQAPVLSFKNRRTLAMMLVRHEMERLATWQSPNPEPTKPGSDWEVVKKSKPTLYQPESVWHTLAKLAWKVHPHLAIQFAYRFSHCDPLQKEVGQLVVRAPGMVASVPEALHFLVTQANVDNNIPELSHALQWCAVAPVTALNLLRRFPGHPIISQYAVRSLHSFQPDVILFCIPQLVQVLRYDHRGFVAQYIKDACRQSQLLAHQLLWNMNTNVYMDEESTQLDPQIGNKLLELIQEIKVIISSLSGRARHFYEREFHFFDEITGISGKIRDFPLGPERKAACLEELKNVELLPGCYLPSNPDSMIVEIDRSSGNPMQSAAKAPFLATFVVKRVALTELENYDDEDLQEVSDMLDAVQAGGGSKGHDFIRQSCIFKVGDDVRQDMLALQIIELFKTIYREIGLDVYLCPYRVVATSPGCGVIECVPDSKSRDQLGKATAASLYEYFISIYGEPDSVAFQQARSHFIRSMAAYSVIGFILQIKDRHNGNIMINKNGHIIHIDFGFMFESSPGGNLGFEPDFKLTEEFVQIMGGSETAAPFQWFRELCIRSYLAVRPYQEQVASLVALMLDTKLPCFRTVKVLESLRDRFKPGKTVPEAAAYMKARIDKSYKNWRSGAYDQLQLFQNKIAC